MKGMSHYFSVLSLGWEERLTCDTQFPCDDDEAIALLWACRGRFAPCSILKEAPIQRRLYLYFLRAVLETLNVFLSFPNKENQRFSCL